MKILVPPASDPMGVEFSRSSRVVTDKIVTGSDVDSPFAKNS